MLAFLDAWGERAAALGWIDVGLFVDHRTAGAIRSNSTGGLLTLYPYAVEAMDECQIVLTRGGSRLASRGLSSASDGAPEWTHQLIDPRGCSRSDPMRCF